MSSNVVKLYPANAAENPDNVLEQCVGEYDRVLVIGRDADGNIDIRASTNVTEDHIIVLCERVKAFIFLSDLEDDMIDT